MRRPALPAIIAVMVLGLLTAVRHASGQSDAQDPKSAAVFPGTELLTWEGDLASRMVDGIDRYLLSRWDVQRKERLATWVATLQGEGRDEFLEDRRSELRYRLGMKDEPRFPTGLRYLAPVGRPVTLVKGEHWEARYVTWPAFGDVDAEGILLEPTGPVRAQVIAVPDADVPPENWVWQEVDGRPQPGPAALLARQGFRVLVPALVDRTLQRRNGRANLSSREFVYRPAFELGRHLVGFEVQQLLTARQLLAEFQPEVPIGLLGHGEGGHLALFAGALDPGFASVLISGHFSTQQDLWNQPLDRNVFGRMLRFGDAELAAMILPRTIIIEQAQGPTVNLPSEGGAPAMLKSPPFQAAMDEVEQLSKYVQLLQVDSDTVTVIAEADPATPLSRISMTDFIKSLGVTEERVDLAADENLEVNPAVQQGNAQRQARLIDAMLAHTQQLLVESPYVRQEFMKELDTSSLEAYGKTVEAYRKTFRHEVIGDVGEGLAVAAPRTRKAYEGEGWTGYDVVLDVFDGVFAYGILLWPDDIKPDEKRPVVVCQHGLEGRPQDIIQGDHPAYHDFAARLAQQGYIVFAPQNLYIFQDRFRTLQRKANPLGLTLFSIMVPQHQQITDWLAGLPNVDPQRIAFYGLSYGGKSAMRIPALVDRYCLSICSADFNEWVWKNASTRAPHSYVWTGEYEIFEFDLGSTFNYSEMAALIAPRPFMVERGHFDGVAPDETVGYEFAKVRHLYAAKLGLADRCEIEWFVGPHTINGQGTYRFLSRHLNWPPQP